MARKPTLVKRIEILYDEMIDQKIIKFIEIHPNRTQYIKGLILKDYKKYLRNPTQYKQVRGLM